MVGGQCGKTFRNLSGLEAWLAAKLALKVFPSGREVCYGKGCFVCSMVT
jgi:hypothetical protein